MDERISAADVREAADLEYLQVYILGAADQRGVEIEDITYLRDEYFRFKGLCSSNPTIEHFEMKEILEAGLERLSEIL